MNSTGVAVTNFQDELKANTRTKEEIEKENNDIKISQINKDANETFERIKSEILRCAKNGDYTTVSDKKVITAIVYMPSNYYSRIEVPATFMKVRKSIFDRPQPPIEDMEAHLKALMQLNPQDRKHYNLVQKTHHKTVFEPINITDYQLFFKELKRLAATESISISPIIIDKKHNNKEYNFPCYIEGNIEWNQYSCLVKCVCTIPEQYSSDILITALYDNTSKSNVLDSGTKQSLISIDDLDGHSFEYVCADLLLKNGYEKVDVTKGSGDQGIDILAYKDGIKYGIQCKCYATDIGNKSVQEAFAGKTYYKCHVGVVLTNRYFTHSAKDLAEANGIILWDRSYLIDLVKQAGINIDN